MEMEMSIVVGLISESEIMTFEIIQSPWILNLQIYYQFLTRK